MASNRIKGLTIEIGGDTRKLSEELKAVEKDGDRLGKELKEVNNLLKFDPGNTEALAEKQKILAEAIANSNEKLKTLKNSQEQVKAQFESGQIDRGQYLKFCEEIAATEKQTADYAKQLEEVKAAQEQAGNSADKAADNINDAAKSEKKAADNADDMAAKSKKASEAVAALAKNAGKISGAAFSAAAKGLTAYATAAMGAVTAVTGLAANAAENAKTVEVMAQRVGFSTEAYQEWDYIAKQAGSTMDTLQGGITDLAEKMDDAASGEGEAAEIFAQLGIAVTDSNGALKNQEEVFNEVIIALQGVEDSSKRQALATKLMSTTGEELLPLINGEIGSLEELKQKAHDVGAVMSGDTVVGLVGLKDSLTDLSAVVSSAGNSISSVFIGHITDIVGMLTSGIPDIAKALAGIFSGETTAEELQAGISDMGGKITTYIVEIMPAVLTGFNSVLLAVLGSISDTAPAAITGLLPSLFDGFNGLVSGLIEQIPVLIPIVIDGGIMLFMGLLDSLQNVSDTLMPMLPDLITDVCDTLTENIPTLITGTVTLFTGLVLGLGDAIPALIEGVYTVVPTVIAALFENIPALIECAVQLFISLAQGIPQAIPTVIEGIPTMINAIVDALMGYDWIGLGVELINGIAGGIVEGAKSIGVIIKDAADSMWNGIKGALGLGNDTKSAANTGEELAQVVTKGFIGTMQENTAEVAAVMPYAKAAEESETYTEEITQQEEQVAAAYVATANTAEKSAKKQTAATKTKTNNILSEAKKAYDKVLDMYKDGKISSEEYNKQYASILKKYSSEQVSITEYAQEKMTEVAEKEAEKRVSTLKKSIETEISEYQKEFDSIQKQMESFSGKLTKAYKDVYTFTTDEKTGKISAKTTDVMIKSKKELEKYLADIEALQKRGVSNVMLQQLTEMSKDEGAAVAEYWMSLTDQQLKNLQSNWTAYNNVSAKISQALYEDEAKTAAEGMLNAIGETLSENESNLQDSGLMILQGLKQGILNDKGINEIKNLCDGIVSAMTGYFNANAVDVSIGAKIMNGNIVSTNSGAGTGGGTGATYNFTQNNYSPKALSRDEINRDTQRQLQLAGMK